MQREFNLTIENMLNTNTVMTFRDEGEDVRYIECKSAFDALNVAEDLALNAVIHERVHDGGWNWMRSSNPETGSTIISTEIGSVRIAYRV